MSNLTNLIQGLVVNAMSQHGGQGSNRPNNNINSSTGGLGGLGGVLGGLLNGQSNHNNQSTGSSGGLGGILGSVLGGLSGQNQNSNPMNNQVQNQSKGMGSQAKLLVVLVPFILAWIQKQGGFHNAVKVLTQSGLGNEVQSWVSNGSNEPVDSRKISKVFSDTDIEQVASQANTSKDDVYSTIANILPQVVDSITTNGQVQGNGSTNQIQQVMSMLSGLKF